jgi:hypothetical protein
MLQKCCLFFVLICLPGTAFSQSSFPYGLNPKCTSSDPTCIPVTCAQFFSDPLSTSCPGECDGAGWGAVYHCANRQAEEHTAVAQASVTVCPGGDVYMLQRVGYVVCTTTRPCECEETFGGGTVPCVAGTPRSATLYSNVPTFRPCLEEIIIDLDT